MMYINDNAIWSDRSLLYESCRDLLQLADELGIKQIKKQLAGDVFQFDFIAVKAGPDVWTFSVFLAGDYWQTTAKGEFKRE